MQRRTIAERIGILILDVIVPRLHDQILCLHIGACNLCSAGAVAAGQLTDTLLCSLFRHRIVDLLYHIGFRRNKSCCKVSVCNDHFIIIIVLLKCFLIRSGIRNGIEELPPSLRDIQHDLCIGILIC